MKIYMNNAATSYPKPPGVAEAVMDAIESLPGSANRAGVESDNVFDDVRKELAHLMRVSDPNRIALTPNATVGLNLALFGFPFSPGDVVVTSLAEHNSVYRPLYALAQRGLIKTVFVPTDPDGRIDPALWEKAFHENPVRLAVFTHASNVTGAVNDAKRLAGIAAKNGASVLLDASQSLGMVDVFPEDWGIDMAAFTGHKYLLGPQGSGGLYVGRSVSLSPHLMGGTGVFSDDEKMPEQMPLRLEAGTGNETSFAGLLAALKWAKENLLDRKHLGALLCLLKDGLKQAGANVIEPASPCTPVVSFTVDGISCEDVGFILTESFDIICRTGLHCAPKIHEGLRYNNHGTVRLSLSRFTTGAEVDAAVRAVAAIAGGGPV